ncbi:pentatricopeptide repeat-containing protein At5g66500, mitochondrial-like [Vigna unguiculata]|uniref:pentatricopeptide repeat-containing protein At5g66500, mitochondrial-like n=1 Tax=Vigna unguiculata TaxID=3917 RepID=UPI0010166A48|nr:pentatricopeptide repeat-containing protein At5g66500, mitochondrial-like [Vigna unguiculata]XP_027931418.1 pentatricopeptide repeat-containing protein At5g66500, mitochondrial-like [Vigna unguiculata]
MILNFIRKTCFTLNLNHLSNIIAIIKHSLHHHTLTTNFSSSYFTRYISQANSLILWHVRRGDPVSAWILFHSLRRARADVDAYTFTSVLRACTLLHISQLGIQVHNQMVKTGADSGTVAKTSLVDMYSKCGSLDEAVKVFDEMDQRDVVAWNALLSGFLRCDLPVKAVGVLRAMGRENVELSEFTLCSALKSCASLKALELGRQVHGLVVCMGRDMVVLSTALIDFYSNVGCVDDALKVFCSLKGWKDDMMYNSLVSGCVRNRRYGEAFRVMGLVRPNVVALTSALVGCSENLDLWAGKQMHSVAVRQGFTRETQLCNALLDMYAKCGKVSLAQSLFDGICEKDVISWTCMIDAYGRNGRGREAVLMFQEMRKEGGKVLPNSVTFLSVLSACGHSGLVEEGKKCFKLLREKYGLEPDPEHYACYIDILGRAGNIEGVWSAYHNMVEQGTRPTAGIWVALLNACSLNQDVERGELAAKHLLQLEPNKSSYIVLVSNFYAAIGRWDRVDELRRIMRTKGLVKEAGNSWINVLGLNQHARSLSI